MSPQQPIEASAKTSRKREHEEFAFDAVDNGNVNPSNGERGHGRDESTLLEGDQAKHTQYPCWRCQIIRRQCDDDSTCRECGTAEGQAWGLGCRRDELAERLKDVIPILPGLGAGDWLLPAIDGINLKIHMRYDNPELEVRDLDHYASEAGVHTKPAIIAFVRQFHNVNTRWGDWYEPVTERLITICAEIQEDLLRNHCEGRESLLGIHVILASALRILGLSHNLMLVEANLHSMSEVEFDKYKTFVDPEEVSAGPNPSIEISRHNATTDTLAEADGMLFSSLIQDIVYRTQRFLLQAEPGDLPVLFCVVCLLKLIQSSAGCDMPYIHQPDINDEFESVCETLCRLYDAASKGHNPLVDTWDSSEYSALVGSNTLALTHFETLNALWIQAGLQDYGDDDNFLRRINRFTNGFEMIG